MALTLAQLPPEILANITAYLEAPCLLITLPICGNQAFTRKLSLSISVLTYELTHMPDHLANSIMALPNLLEFSFLRPWQSRISLQAINCLIHRLPSTLTSLDLDCVGLCQIISFPLFEDRPTQFPLIDPEMETLNLQRLFPRLQRLSLQGPEFRQDYCNLSVGTRLRFLSSLPRSLTSLSMPAISAVPISPWSILPPTLTKVTGDPHLLPTANLPKTLSESLLHMKLEDSLSAENVRRHSDFPEVSGGTVYFGDTSAERRHFPPAHDFQSLVFPPNLTHLSLTSGSLLTPEGHFCFPPTLTNLYWTGGSQPVAHPFIIFNLLPSSLVLLQLIKWTFDGPYIAGTSDTLPVGARRPAPFVAVKDLNFRYTASLPLQRAQELHNDVITMFPNVETLIYLHQHHPDVGFEPRGNRLKTLRISTLAPKCFEKDPNSPNRSYLASWTPNLTSLAVTRASSSNVTAVDILANLPPSVTSVDLANMEMRLEDCAPPPHVTALIVGTLRVSSIHPCFYEPGCFMKDPRSGRPFLDKPLSLTLGLEADFKHIKAADRANKGVGSNAELDTSNAFWISCNDPGLIKISLSDDAVVSLPPSLTFLKIGRCFKEAVDLDSLVALSSLTSLHLPNHSLPIDWPLHRLRSLATLKVDHISRNDFHASVASEPFLWPPNLMRLHVNRVCNLSEHTLPLPVSLREIQCGGFFSPFSALKSLSKLQSFHFTLRFMDFGDAFLSIHQLPPSITELSMPHYSQTEGLSSLYDLLPRLKKLEFRLDATGSDSEVLEMSELEQLGIEVHFKLSEAFQFFEPARLLTTAGFSHGQLDLGPGELLEDALYRVLLRTFPRCKQAKYRSFMPLLNSSTLHLAFPFLSATLKELKFGTTTLPADFAAYLPRTLTNLQAWSIASPQAECTVGLPEGLLRLAISSEEFEARTYEAIPRGLRVLEIISCAHFEPDFAQALPPRLVSFASDVHSLSLETLRELPSSIFCLSLRRMLVSTEAVGAMNVGVKRIVARRFDGNKEEYSALIQERQLEHLGPCYEATGTLAENPIETVLDALISGQMDSARDM